MKRKKRCIYCEHFDMDMKYIPIRYMCKLHKRRIVKDEAETCLDFTKFIIQTRKEE